jgi:hypothetical protein
LTGCVSSFGLFLAQRAGFSSVDHPSENRNGTRRHPSWCSPRTSSSDYRECANLNDKEESRRNVGRRLKRGLLSIDTKMACPPISWKSWTPFFNSSRRNSVLLGLESKRIEVLNWDVLRKNSDSFDQWNWLMER